MIAKGHTSGIYDLDFSADGTKLVTVSKDGTWRLHKVHHARAFASIDR